MLIAAARVESELITRAPVSPPVVPESPVKLLVVDDDADMLAVVSFALRQASFPVVAAQQLRHRAGTFRNERPDLTILDINLPGGSGFELCGVIRQGKQQSHHDADRCAARKPIWCARSSSVPTTISTKPFSPRTLVARVKALLRRAGHEAPTPTQAGELALDSDQLLLKIGERAVKVTPLESSSTAPAAGQRRPGGAHRAAAGACMGASRRRRSAAAQAAGAPPASEDRR